MEGIVEGVGLVEREAAPWGSGGRAPLEVVFERGKLSGRESFCGGLWRFVANCGAFGGLW